MGDQEKTEQLITETAVTIQLQYVTENGNLRIAEEGTLEECEDKLDSDSHDGMPEHQIVSVIKSAILFKESVTE